MEEREGKTERKEGIFRGRQRSSNGNIGSVVDRASRTIATERSHLFFLFLFFFTLFFSVSLYLTQVSDAILDACLEQDPDAKVGRKRKKDNDERQKKKKQKKPESEAIEFFPLELFFSTRSHLLSLETRNKKNKKIKLHIHNPATTQVACETATKTNMIMVFGEITTKAKVDYEAIVRKTAREIGFTSDDVGLDADKCKVLVHLEEQSPDIGQGVHGLGTKSLEEIGAGDQGHMFG